MLGGVAGGAEGGEREEKKKMHMSRDVTSPSAGWERLPCHEEYTAVFIPQHGL